MVMDIRDIRDIMEIINNNGGNDNGQDILWGRGLGEMVIRIMMKLK